MGVMDLLAMASMPIVKVLLISALGSFLALDRVDLLGENARMHMNKVVYFVFNPALVASNLAKTITYESFLTLWFMPVNVFISFFVGSILGWILTKITKPPKHLKGLVIGACSAGNMGKLPLIIVPAICKEKGSPFGDVDVCQSYGLSYASLSMALGAVYLWSYVYNIIRISSRDSVDSDEIGSACASVSSSEVCDDTLLFNNNNNYSEPLLLPSADYSLITVNQSSSPSRMQQWLTSISQNINLKAMFAPSTMGAVAGFIIGMIPLLRNLLIGNSASLHVVQDSAYLIGEAAIPTVTLILGANLLSGLKGSQIEYKIVIGIAAIRYVLLPLVGILIVRGVVRAGVHLEPLLQFVLLLQYAVPPAMNIGTMTQLFGKGQSEYSVIMLWTYGLAAIALTLWSTLFLWLVAS